MNSSFLIKSTVRATGGSSAWFANRLGNSGGFTAHCLCMVCTNSELWKYKLCNRCLMKPVCEPSHLGNIHTIRYYRYLLIQLYVNKWTGQWKISYNFWPADLSIAKPCITGQISARAFWKCTVLLCSEQQVKSYTRFTTVFIISTIFDSYAIMNRSVVNLI